MRNALFLALAALAVSAGPVAAQQGKVRLRIDPIASHVGFPNAWPGSEYRHCFKAGLWAPVVVKFAEDERGNVVLPVAADGSISGTLLVETADNDNVSTIYPMKFTFAAKEPMELVTYTKLTGIRPDLKFTVTSGDRSFDAMADVSAGLGVGHHLYLVLGENAPDFHEALVKMSGAPKEEVKETRPRYLAHQSDVTLMPTQWFAYEGVDLAVLLGGSGKFLDRLLVERQSSPQLEALAEWVRRGGRLVVSAAPQTREKVYQLLASPAWKPALPRVLVQDGKAFELLALDGVRNWANALQERFRKLKEDEKSYGQGVRLEAPLTVAVDCTEKDGKEDVPLIVRFPHGLGSITVIGFDVKDAFINEWGGRFLFWQQIVKKLAPANTGVAIAGMQPWQVEQFEAGISDKTTKIYQDLEQFDTPRISFGWVALFIMLYILVVGPVDYLVLKFVFKRLEWTWITFPAVVLTVSALAYFTAYAIKGEDLKVNKIDLIDLDLRSALDENFRTTSARIYGTTWFAIQSPRIQNYTIGIEPVPYLWQKDGVAPLTPIEPTMSWLGRPEVSGMGAVGRGRAPSLFSRTYSYEPSAVGLRDVPIPVWTTRSFGASWETAWEKGKLPLEPNLRYEPGKFLSVEGTLTNNLPIELSDVALIYLGKAYPLAALKPGETVQVVLDPQREQNLSTWANEFQGFDGRDPSRTFLPRQGIRNLMFHERLDPSMRSRNHSHRALDFSWRLGDQASEGRVRDLILVATVGRAVGGLEPLHAANDTRLPTHLWLGEIPGTPIAGEMKAVKRADGKMENVPVYRSRPSMQGKLVQETLLRAVLPVAPIKQ
jgi:hypothetical protein